MLVWTQKNAKKVKNFEETDADSLKRYWAIVFRVDFSYNYLLEKQIGHFFDTIKGTLYGFCQKKKLIFELTLAFFSQL